MENISLFLAFMISNIYLINHLHSNCININVDDYYCDLFCICQKTKPCSIKLTNASKKIDTLQIENIHTIQSSLFQHLDIKILKITNSNIKNITESFFNNITNLNSIHIQNVYNFDLI